MPLILLVDDDDALRTMLLRTLQKMGHDVMVASNGNQALRLCETEPPQLVLTDLIMPDKEGLETIATLHRRSPDIRVIAMSGGARINASDMLKIARHMGAHAVLQKPFSNDELAIAIDAVLRNEPLETS